MKLSLLAILTAGLWVTVAGGQEDATKKDKEQIQGTWRLVSREKDGKADSEESIKDQVMINTGSNFAFKGASGSGATKGTFKLDASKKPKAMDRTPADGTRKGVTLLGIYALEGDTLTICVSLERKERPEAFKTAPKSGLVLSVFKREK